MLFIFSGDSRIWNVILWLHGMDIDMASGLSAGFVSFTPSVVDQVFVRRSFLANWLSFREGDKVEIVDSTAGYGSVFFCGIKVHRSTTRVYSDVYDSVYDDFPRSADSSQSMCASIVVGELVWLMYFVLFCASFVPSFEILLLMMSVQSILGQFFCVVAGVVLQFFVWTMYAYLFQSIALILLKFKSSIPNITKSWYYAFLDIVATNSMWGHWFLLWGTPFHNGLARLMGATIEGDMLFNGKAMHDFHCLTFKDKTIVDESQLGGHIQIGKELTVGAATHSGVLHYGCFTMSGTNMEGSKATEFGPMRTIFGTSQHKPMVEASETRYTEEAKQNALGPRAHVDNVCGDTYSKGVAHGF